MTTRIPLLIATTGVACVGAVAVLSTQVHERTEATEHRAMAIQPVQRAEWSARVQYPYSIHPGGVINDTEFQAAKRNDAVVAELYRDVDHLGTRQGAPDNMWVYVSYRANNRIAWTSAKHRIPAGELLFIGNGAIVRERCVNRLSYTPKGPTLSLPEERIVTTAMTGVDDHDEVNGQPETTAYIESTPHSNIALPNERRRSQYTGLIPILPATIGGLWAGYVPGGAGAALVATAAPEPASVWITAVGIIGALVGAIWAERKKDRRAAR